MLKFQTYITQFSLSITSQKEKISEAVTKEEQTDKPQTDMKRKERREGQTNERMTDE